ncbi:MAG: type II toxin-antitoxin system VapC family toxin [bacterium]|nr:type II toxin-antitoxin system VapC family toxin [bacterium]
MYTLDTNAIIYYFKGNENAASILEDVFRKSSPVYISSITEVELFGFPRLTPKESKQIDSLINTLSVISLDSRIARLAGFLRRKYGVKTPDSVIAATAIFTGTTLITRNVRDFQKIPNFPLLSI